MKRYADEDIEKGRNKMKKTDSITKESIFAKLREVIDPELGINIVDMGLIYEVKVQKNKGYVRMTFTTPACPLINQIVDQVKTKLEEFKGMDINVDIVFDPPWNPDMMSEGAKLKLGMI